MPATRLQSAKGYEADEVRKECGSSRLVEVSVKGACSAQPQAWRPALKEHAPGHSAVAATDAIEGELGASALIALNVKRHGLRTVHLFATQVN